MFFSSINLWAVLVSAVAYIGLGFLWYSRFAFGKMWIEAKGWTKDTFTPDTPLRGILRMYVGPVAAALLFTWVLAGLFNSLVPMGLWWAILTGFTVWAGFMLPLFLNNLFFTRTPITVFLIDAGYQLCGTILASKILFFMM